MTDKITLELTLEELKTLDKYVELNDETESVFDKIKYAYPQPKMTLENEGEYAVVSYNDTTYYRLMNETTFSWYKKIVVIPSFPTPSLVMVDDAETERLLEGLYYNHIEVKKETAQERGERVHNEMEELVRESVKWCEEHPDKDPLDWLRPQAPIPTMELLKDGSVFCVEYNNVTYYRQEYRHSNGWIKWWRENDEGGILTRVDDAETFRLLEKLFSADIAANPDGSLKFMFGPTLYDVIAEWWDEIFVNGNPSGQNAESLVEQIKEWLPKPQSAAGSQSVGVEELVQGWNDCLERIKSKLS